MFVKSRPSLLYHVTTWKNCGLCLAKCQQRHTDSSLCAFYNKVMRSWFKIFMQDPLLHNDHKIDDLLTNHISKRTEENLRCYRKPVYYRREDNSLVVLVNL